MAKGRILIIEQDEWDSTLLTKFLGDAGYEVHVSTEARAGFDMVRELRPDCILCDVRLPDIDGFWVARRVRAEPTRVASTPFLFLTDEGDSEARLQGLNVGADLHLARPFRNEEVVAQVSALIDMAARLQKKRESVSDAPNPISAAGAAFQGDLAQMSLATVLSLIELERRSGYLKVCAESGNIALLELSEGCLLTGTIDEQPEEPTTLLRGLLHWKKGRFSFRGADVKAPSGPRQGIGSLLLDAARQEDEARR